MRNRDKYNWNVVFNYIMEIKDKYIEKFGQIDYKTYEHISVETGGKRTLSCVEFWVQELNCDDMIKRLYPLQINQEGALILIRYGDYTSAKEGEVDTYTIKDEEFFDVYDSFYKECRSLVIDVENETIVIAPFKKFRNLNEGEENLLENIEKRCKEAKNIEISEKLDGSMQCATYYKNDIFMSGAQALSPEKSWRLTDGLTMLRGQENYCKMIKENIDKTFIFEYISLKDAHVVKYTKEQEGLYLIGIRDNTTGIQYSYKDVLDLGNKYNIPKTTQVFNKKIEDVLQELDKYSSDQAEGVVVNIDGFMVKIKYNDYCKIHRILSFISSYNLIIESIAENRFDDLISKVPVNYKERVMSVANIIFDYCKSMENAVVAFYNEAMESSKGDKKSFMIYLDTIVPKKYRNYIRQKYLNRPYNYLKKNWNSTTPGYHTISELGLTDKIQKLKEEDEQ